MFFVLKRHTPEKCAPGCDYHTHTKTETHTLQHIGSRRSAKTSYGCLARNQGAFFRFSISSVNKKLKRNRNKFCKPTKTLGKPRNTVGANSSCGKQQKRKGGNDKKENSLQKKSEIFETNKNNSNNNWLGKQNKS